MKSISDQDQVDALFSGQQAAGIQQPELVARILATGGQLLLAMEAEKQYLVCHNQPTPLSTFASLDERSSLFLGHSAAETVRGHPVDPADELSAVEQH